MGKMSVNSHPCSQHMCIVLSRDPLLVSMLRRRLRIGQMRLKASRNEAPPVCKERRMISLDTGKGREKMPKELTTVARVSKSNRAPRETIPGKGD
uniref:Uncharacterized protein n=1 Tax=Heterorhabditis bacteriophora TaxID=37862 RepID=A0A1I7X2T5_HETBA